MQPKLFCGTREGGGRGGEQGSAMAGQEASGMDLTRTWQHAV